MARGTQARGSACQRTPKPQWVRCEKRREEVCVAGDQIHTCTMRDACAETGRCRRDAGSGTVAVGHVSACAVCFDMEEASKAWLRHGRQKHNKRMNSCIQPNGLLVRTTYRSHTGLHRKINPRVKSNNTHQHSIPARMSSAPGTTQTQQGLRQDSVCQAYSSERAHGQNDNVPKHTTTRTHSRHRESCQADCDSVIDYAGLFLEVISTKSPAVRTSAYPCSGACAHTATGNLACSWHRK